MKKIVIIAMLLPLLAVAQVKVFKGVIVDEEKMPLAYPAVRTQLCCEGVLGDRAGRFVFPMYRTVKRDSIVVSYVGYKPEKIALADIDSLGSDTIVLRPESRQLAEVCVFPAKIKKKVSGKKHSWAMMTTAINDPIAGECFGYEFHAKKQRRLLLYKVGFYYCDGDNQMSRMKFRINVYDMSDVRGSVTTGFKPVLAQPVYFDFILPDDGGNGKFEYCLPEAVVLPDDAMVEIEFVDNLNGEVFLFKSNMIGGNTWSKTVGEGFWCKSPFASPFFVECIEEKL